MPLTDSLSARWGQRLAEQRKAAGLSVPVLAEQVGVHRTQLYKIEKGQTRPSDDLRIRLAAALDVDVHALFSYDEPDEAA